MGSSGIWNHAAAASISMAGARSMDTTGGGSSTSSSDSATISANDFLTLLVTEMQNQDPTADTDPNEYINQLVQVNSLEQLIDINQTLTTDSTPASPGSSLPGVPVSKASGSAASQTSSVSGTSAASSRHGAGGKDAARAGNSAVPVTGARTTRSVLSQAAAAFQGSGAQTTNGNLGVPTRSAAARRVAQSLNGQTQNE